MIDVITYFVSLLVLMTVLSTLSDLYFGYVFPEQCRLAEGKSKYFKF